MYVFMLYGTLPFKSFLSRMIGEQFDYFLIKLKNDIETLLHDKLYLHFALKVHRWLHQIQLNKYNFHVYFIYQSLSPFKDFCMKLVLVIKLAWNYKEWIDYIFIDISFLYSITWFRTKVDRLFYFALFLVYFFFKGKQTQCNFFNVFYDILVFWINK